MTFKEPLSYPRSVPYRAPDSPRSGDLTRAAASWEYTKDLDQQLDAEVPPTVVRPRREPDAVSGTLRKPGRTPWMSMNENLTAMSNKC